MWERSYRAHSVETAQSWFTAAWDREISELLDREPDINNWLAPGRTKPQTDLENRYERGLGQVAGYIDFASRDTLTPLEIRPGEPAAEVPFEIDLDGVTVIGYIDLIMESPDGRLLVRDVKTGTKLPVSPLQLAVYALAVEDLTGVRPLWGDYYMAKNNAPTAPISLRYFSRDIVTRWFHQMHRAELDGVYLPNPGDHCKTCSVRRFCSVMGTDRSFF